MTDEPAPAPGLPQSPPGPQFAGFWRRVAAVLIDYIALSIVLFVLALAISAVFGQVVLPTLPVEGLTPTTVELVSEETELEDIDAKLGAIDENSVDVDIIEAEHLEVEEEPAVAEIETETEEVEVVQAAQVGSAQTIESVTQAALHGFTRGTGHFGNLRECQLRFLLQQNFNQRNT